MSLGIKLIILFLLSATYTVLTWRSLLNIQKHGLYRLMSWITASALILLNIEYWFYEPYSYSQLGSWALLLASIISVIYGTVSLLHGSPDKHRIDDSLLEIEKTTVLVTSGAYRYVRHPIYASILLGVWGVFLKHVSWFGLILASLASISAIVTAKKEECENTQYFGNDYRAYMKKTKRFIPFVY